MEQHARGAVDDRVLIAVGLVCLLAALMLWLTSRPQTAASNEEPSQLEEEQSQMDESLPETFTYELPEL